MSAETMPTRTRPNGRTRGKANGEAVERRTSARSGQCQVFLFDAARVKQVRDAMPDADTIQDVADTFKVLAHPSRLKIIHALSAHELCVCDLAQVLGLSVSATSHQLQAMRQLRLVRFRTDGKLAYYSLQDGHVLAMLRDALLRATGEEDHGR